MTPEAVIRAVCEAYSIPEAALLGRSRSLRHARPRQVVYWLLVSRLGYSLVEAAKALNRDPTTIGHGDALIADRVRVDFDLAAKCDQVLGVLHAEPRMRFDR